MKRDPLAAAIVDAFRRSISTLSPSDQQKAIDWLWAASDDDSGDIQRGILANILDGTIEIVAMDPDGPRVRLRDTLQ